MSDGQRTWLARALNQTAAQRADDALVGAGLMLPCQVTSVSSAGPQIVTVAFQVKTALTLPPVTLPTIGSRYVRLPIQVGDLGFCVRADARLGGVSGLGQTTDLSTPSNMGALVFAPIGNMGWSSVNPNAVTITDPTNGTVLTVSPTGFNVAFSSTVSIALTSAGMTLAGAAGTEVQLSSTGINLVTSDLMINSTAGWSGTFATGDSRTVTVQHGIITSVA